MAFGRPTRYDKVNQSWFELFDISSNKIAATPHMTPVRVQRILSSRSLAGSVYFIRNVTLGTSE